MKVIIIGGGLVGLSAAMTVRQAGHNVTVCLSAPLPLKRYFKLTR